MAHGVTKMESQHHARIRIRMHQSSQALQLRCHSQQETARLHFAIFCRAFVKAM
jgi:hypothetical protein